MLNALGDAAPMLPLLPAFVGGSRPGSAVPSQPTSPSKPSTRSDPDKLAKALRHTIAELVSTEQTYVGRLQALVSTFADPISTAPSAFSLREGECRLLFGNVRKILAAHKAMLAALEAMDAGDVTAVLREQLARCVPLYASYIDGQRTATDLLKDARERSDTLVRFLDNARGTLTQAATLDSLMAEPFQRLPRYILLMDSASLARVLRLTAQTCSRRCRRTMAVEASCSASSSQSASCLTRRRIRSSSSWR